jgi:heptosyltransferase-2
MPELKILIIRLSSIGDILLTTQFIRLLRNKFPAAGIDYLVKNEYVRLLQDNPHLNRVIEYDTGTVSGRLPALRKMIKRNGYDYILDLHNNWRSNVLRRWQPGAKTEYIRKDKWRQQKLVRFHKNTYTKIITISERYLAVGSFLGITDDGGGLELAVNDRYHQSVQRYLKDNGIGGGSKFAAVAPGAGFFTKRWPLEYYEELCRLLYGENKIQLLVLGSHDDKEAGTHLSALPGVVDLTGKLNLLETAAVIQQSLFLVANDSGLMHMATAVNTPVLAIFGSSVQELGFFPFRGRSMVVENRDLYCRPCSHIGKNRCPQKHFRCMRELQPQQIYTQLKKLTGIPA